VLRLPQLELSYERAYCAWMAGQNLAKEYAQGLNFERSLDRWRMPLGTRMLSASM